MVSFLLANLLPGTTGISGTWSSLLPCASVQRLGVVCTYQKKRKQLLGRCEGSDCFFSIRGEGPVSPFNLFLVITLKPEKLSQMKLREGYFVFQALLSHDKYAI